MVLYTTFFSFHQLMDTVFSLFLVICFNHLTKLYSFQVIAKGVSTVHGKFCSGVKINWHWEITVSSEAGTYNFKKIIKVSQVMAITNRVVVSHIKVNPGNLHKKLKGWKQNSDRKYNFFQLQNSMWSHLPCTWSNLTTLTCHNLEGMQAAVLSASSTWKQHPHDRERNPVN